MQKIKSKNGKINFLFVFLFFDFFFLISPFSSLAGINQKERSPSRSKVIESEAGLNIPQWGVAIDAIYNRELDNLIPGYKILNVVVSNRGGDIISFDTLKDRWILVDSVGKSHKAINHLRVIDQKMWDVLPVGLKNELEYPQTLRVGHTAKIDLLFRSSAELTSFKTLRWRSTHFKKDFVIRTAIEKNLDWEPKEEPIPSTKATRQAEEKYEGEKETQNPTETPKEENPPRFDPTLDDFTIPMDE